MGGLLSSSLPSVTFNSKRAYIYEYLNILYILTRPTETPEKKKMF